MKRKIFFDGACLPVNPGGIACWGIVAVENGNVVTEKSGIVSRKGTNNIAEWTGLIEAIRLAKELDWRNVSIFGDSKLVVNQFNGLWGTHKEHLRKLCRKAESEAKGLLLKVSWIPRESNLADPVCHKAFIQDIEARAEEKAKKQFQNYAIRQEGNVFVVWKNGNVSYQVSFAPLSCTCPAFRRWKNYPLLKRSNIVLRCKHHFIIEFLTKGIENAS